jgi:hypothetical protein
MSSQDELNRRQSTHAFTGSSLNPGESLGGWGTFSASSQLSVAELDSLVASMKAMTVDASAASTESELKKACFRLQKALTDAEVAQRFQAQGGLPALCFALATLKGSSLAYAVGALRTYATHGFAMESVIQSQAVQVQLWQVLKANQANMQVTKAVLTLLTDVVQRTADGFNYVWALHVQNSSQLFPVLVNAIGAKAGLDQQTSSLKLINALLSSAKTDKHFHAVLDELHSTPASIPGGANGVLPVTFTQSLEALSNDPSPVLKDELAHFAQIKKQGFQARSEASTASRQEVALLKSQLADISALATEYRSTTARLEGELKNFKRREPLVQLLWAEIQQLRGALNVATAAGFAYDLSDPSSRYVKPSHFAYIDRLDVARWAGSAHAQQGQQGQAQALPQIGEEGSSSSAASRMAARHQPTMSKKHAGMRSGDDAEAIADSLGPGGFVGGGGQSHLSGPSGFASDGALGIAYDMPPPPPPMEEPAGEVPSAPDAPFAPPMAPGVPSAPGAPVSTGRHSGVECSLVMLLCFN